MGRTILVVVLAGSFGCTEGPAPKDRSPASAPASRRAAVPLVALGASLATQAGHFRISARPAEPPIQIGRMERWIVEIRDREDRPAENVQVRFDGGMPAHGHGLPTAPRVTRKVGPGAYLVEGVKLHMAGEWTLQVDVRSSEAQDSARFRIHVGP